MDLFTRLASQQLAQAPALRPALPAHFASHGSPPTADAELESHDTVVAAAARPLSAAAPSARAAGIDNAMPARPLATAARATVAAQEAAVQPPQAASPASPTSPAHGSAPSGGGARVASIAAAPHRVAAGRTAATAQAVHRHRRGLRSRRRRWRRWCNAVPALRRRR